MTQHMTFLSLGANLGDKALSFTRCLESLALDPQIELQEVSGVYESEAIDLAEASAPDFWNMVISLQTTHSPEELLRLCQDIEMRLGRQYKGSVKLSRKIDIDILFFGDVVYKKADLTIPHPHISRRDFILMPLGELVDQTWREPVSGMTHQQMLQNCQQSSQVKSIGTLRNFLMPTQV